MTLNTIKGYDFTQKRVVMRVDFNILLDEKNDARDIYKLKAVQESIAHILSFDGVRLALISHRGRPTGQNQKHFTMAYLADDIARILNHLLYSFDIHYAVVTYELAGEYGFGAQLTELE